MNKMIVRNKYVPFVIILMLTGGFSACGRTSLGGYLFLNHDERAYLLYVHKAGSEIELPVSRLASAWARADTFVQLYSSFPEKINDTLISPRVPIVWSTGYAYWVRAEHYSDTVIHVSIFSREGFLDNIGFPLLPIQYNSYILADYMRTGKLPYPDLVSK